MRESGQKTPKPDTENKQSTVDTSQQDLTEEQGGTDRLEPTRYGDWESKGRCIDF